MTLESISKLAIEALAEVNRFGSHGSERSRVARETTSSERRLCGSEPRWATGFADMPFRDDLNGVCTAGPVSRHPAELMLPAVDLGGRVWLGGKPCKGGPAAPAFGG